MIIVYVKYGNAAWLIFPMCPFNVSSRPRTWLRSVTFKPSWRTPSRRSRRFRKRWVFLVGWLPCCLVALLMLFTCKKIMKKMLGFKLWNPHIMNSCSGPPPPVWIWWPKMTHSPPSVILINVTSKNVVNKLTYNTLFAFTKMFSSF